MMPGEGSPASKTRLPFGGLHNRGADTHGNERVGPRQQKTKNNVKTLTYKIGVSINAISVIACFKRHYSKRRLFLGTRGIIIAQ